MLCLRRFARLMTSWRLNSVATSHVSEDCHLSHLCVRVSRSCLGSARDHAALGRGAVVLVCWCAVSAERHKLTSSIMPTLSIKALYLYAHSADHSLPEKFDLRASMGRALCRTCQPKPLALCCILGTQHAGIPRHRQGGGKAKNGDGEPHEHPNAPVLQ